jgi:glycosyltransferase involved in cell wall biosynthesis
MLTPPRPLVSVIIPAYNVGGYIDQSLDSLVNQTYTNLEIIVIDDGSTDETTKLKLDLWSLKSDKVTVLTNETNRGPSYSRNRGLDLAKGDYIAFCDADDWMELDGIEKMVSAALVNDEIDVVFTDYNKVYYDKTVRNRTLFEDHSISRQLLAHYALRYLNSPTKFLLYSHSWSVLFRSHLFDGVRFDPDLYSFEDTNLNFEVLSKVRKAYYVNEVSYNHRIRSSNYTSTAFSIDRNNIGKLFGYRTALPKMRSFIESNLSPEWLDVTYGNGFTRLTIVQLIRTCGQIDCSNRRRIYEYIKGLVNGDDVKEAIQHYIRKEGESRLIPWLIRRRWSYLLMVICQLRAKKRYG